MQRDDTISSNTDRRWIRRVVVVAVTLAVAIPTAAWAGHQFTDVPNSNIFHEDIDWMADNDVTKGCNPPANTEYCPDDFVTREQMAAFMHRLESEGVFLPADGKAADADELDGMDSTDFMPRFAVIADNAVSNASVLSSRGLLSMDHTEDTGIYLLTFDADVSDCSWNVTPGHRNGGTWSDGFGRTANAHNVSSQPTQVRVEGKDPVFDDAETSFNLVINC